MNFTRTQLEQIEQRKLETIIGENGSAKSVVELSAEEFEEFIYLAGIALDFLEGTSGYE